MISAHLRNPKLLTSIKTLKSDWMNKYEDPMTRPTSLCADNITVNVVINLGAKIDICASFGNRQEPMIYRLWLTGLFRRVYVHPCRRASLKSPSSGRRCVHLVIWGRSACFGSNQWNIILYVDWEFILFVQELPAEDVEEELLENGHSSVILQKSCPDQYASLKEEEVKRERKQNMGIMLEKL